MKYCGYGSFDIAAWIETGYTFWSVCHNGVNRIARLLDRIIQNTWVGDADDTRGSLSGERQQQLCCIRVCSGQQCGGKLGEEARVRQAHSAKWTQFKSVPSLEISTVVSVCCWWSGRGGWWSTAPSHMRTWVAGLCVPSTPHGNQQPHTPQGWWWSRPLSSVLPQRHRRGWNVHRLLS